MYFITLAHDNFIMRSPENSLGNILHVPTNTHTRSKYTRKDHAFLHLFHTTLYNSMNKKQPCFNFILYERGITNYKKYRLMHIIHLYTLIRLYIKMYFLIKTHTNASQCPWYTYTFSYNHTYNNIYSPTFHLHKKIVFTIKNPTQATSQFTQHIKLGLHIYFWIV